MWCSTRDEIYALGKELERHSARPVITRREAVTDGAHVTGKNSGLSVERATERADVDLRSSARACASAPTISKKCAR